MNNDFTLVFWTCDVTPSLGPHRPGKEGKVACLGIYSWGEVALWAPFHKPLMQQLIFSCVYTLGLKEGGTHK